MDKTKFFGATRKTVTVDIPEIGEVTLRQISVKDQQGMLDFREAGNNAMACNAFLVAQSVYEGDARVFANSEISSLMEMPAAIFRALMDAINKLNGWDGGEDEKNSVAAPGANSSSASV